MAWESILGGVLVTFLVIYALTGGADFGGGVWDLLALGKRSEKQRDLIARAIGPIWEANHVWLIAIIVVLFVAFPRMCAAMANALHIPLTLMLFGIVLRGSAFVFRKYDLPSARRTWSRVFAISSTITPIMLGICLGSLSTGALRFDARGNPIEGFIKGWLGLFPFMVGLLTLTLFAFLAAVYLAAHTNDSLLRKDVRMRALVCGGILFVLSWATFLVAGSHAPFLARGLGGQVWSLPFHLTTGMVAVMTLLALWQERYAWARLLAGGQAVLMILGWAFSQYPYLIYPDFTVVTAAAPQNILRMTFWVLVGGSVITLPAFVYLYRIFAFTKESG